MYRSCFCLFSDPTIALFCDLLHVFVAPKINGAGVLIASFIALVLVTISSSPEKEIFLEKYGHRFPPQKGLFAELTLIQQPFWPVIAIKM
jgi:hypothetical protein